MNTINIDIIDERSMDFTDWRFNLRSSNTEPLLKLHVASKANTALMERKTKDILALLTQE